MKLNMAWQMGSDMKVLVKKKKNRLISVSFLCLENQVAPLI